MRLKFSVTAVRKCPEKYVLGSKIQEIVDLIQKDIEDIDNSNIRDRVVIVCQDEQMVVAMQKEFRYTRFCTTILTNQIGMQNKDFTSGSKPIGIATLATARAMPAFKTYIMMTMPENAEHVGEMLSELELAGRTHNVQIRLELIVSAHDVKNGLPEWLQANMSAQDISRLEEYDDSYGDPDGTLSVPPNFVSNNGVFEMGMPAEQKTAEKDSDECNYGNM